VAELKTRPTKALAAIMQKATGSRSLQRIRAGRINYAR
jgi:hypothetical protein